MSFHHFPKPRRNDCLPAWWRTDAEAEKKISNSFEFNRTHVGSLWTRKLSLSNFLHVVFDPIHAFKVFGWNEEAEAEEAEEAWRITLTRDKWPFPKIHLDHDESRYRSWKFLSKFATHQTIKLPIDSAINGDHLRPPALAALLALLAAQPEAINWERPRIDGNSQQHASALEKAYDTHCLWILHPKWLNRAAETRSKQKTLRPKNSSASPDLEKNQSTHAIVTALIENWSPTTQLLYHKGWLAEGGLHISVEPALPPRSFEAFELNTSAFQMGASGNKSHDRSVSR